MCVMIYAKTKQNRVGAHVLNEEQRVEAHVLNGEQTEGAVLYTAQTLTAEEQAQARENINAPGFSDIPQKTSELENDSGFITADDIPAIPEKTSELENDSGFITSDDIPAIPEKTSELQNDSGFVTADEQVKQLSVNSSSYSYWRPLPIGESSSGTEGFVPTTRTGGTYTFPTLQVQPSTGTIRMGKASFFNGSYTHKLSPTTLTANRKATLPNKSGTIAFTDDIPPVPVQSVNGQTGAVNLTNLVQDLGSIDGDAYDWGVETFLNTLQETGSYTFFWDEFKYFVDIKAVEVDGTTTVQQIFWGTEEGPGTTAYRNIVVESGEIVEQHTITYLTFQEANSAFARNTHVHYRTDAKATSVWDYCNTVALQNANPIVIYFDSSTNKTYLIETYVGNRQPVYKMQKVTEMNDISYFCQRSSYYYGGAEHWGNWYKFTGEVYTPGR